MIKKPLFIQIPTHVTTDARIKYSDAKLYGYILALHNLRDGCTASNDTLGELVGIKERQIRNSLDKLEQYGYIRRHYGKNKRVRVSIQPLILIKSEK